MIGALQPGTLLARRYRLLDRIGTGGMSVVWQAHDEVLDRIVALKALAPALAVDPRFRSIVQAEARAAARLVHPHVTAVHDYGESIATDGSITAFVVMELLTGEELEHRLAAGPLPWTEAVEIGAQVAEALAAAHQLDIVHRDVTPANVMITHVGTKVLDFGIATRVGTPDDDEDGGGFGTPAYVAPERLHGAAAQPSADVYSLGVLLYETLTGQVPYPAHTWEQVEAALASGPPPSLAGVAGLPPLVARACLRCLARDPADRPTAAQVAVALREQLASHARSERTVPLPPTPAEAVPSDDQPPASGAQPARPRRWMLTLVAGSAALLVAALLLRPDAPERPLAPTVAVPTIAPFAAPTGPGAQAPTSAASRSSPRAAPPRTPVRGTGGAGTSASATPSGGTDDNQAGATARTTAEQTLVDGQLLVAATERLDKLIRVGVAAGAIRPDVGTDLTNLVGDLRAAAASGSDLTGPTARLREKIDTRLREGAISPRYARQLDTALARLARG